MAANGAVKGAYEDCTVRPDYSTLNVVRTASDSCLQWFCAVSVVVAKPMQRAVK